MARNFFRIFTENNPVMWDSKTLCIPEAKGLRHGMILYLPSPSSHLLILTLSFKTFHIEEFSSV